MRLEDRGMFKKNPKYYRYVVLFEGDTSEVEPILKVSDLNQLKQENKNHMHLFDELLILTLPALEYCLHLPRCEMDTYDTPIELLDVVTDMAHDIQVMPMKIFLLFPIDAALVICAEGCNVLEVEKVTEQLNIELGVISVKDLCRDLLITQWNLLYEHREVDNAVKLPDIDQQFILSNENMLFLSTLNTARQYNGINDVYCKIFNATNIFEVYAKIIWNQRVHHNGLIYCKGFDGNDIEKLRKIYNEGMEKAKKKYEN